MFLTVLVLLGLAFPQRQAGAEAKYPSKPVRIVLPFAAGGVADITARVIAEKLSGKLGGRFYIENQPGAGGIAAARTVISSRAGRIYPGAAVQRNRDQRLPVQPFALRSPEGFRADFEPRTFDFVFATNANSPFKTLADFIAAAKAKPGTLNVGTINIGSTQNLSAELFKTAAGIDFTIIPYRGTPELLSRPCRATSL